MWNHCDKLGESLSAPPYFLCIEAECYPVNIIILYVSRVIINSVATSLSPRHLYPVFWLGGETSSGLGTRLCSYLSGVASMTCLSFSFLGDIHFSMANNKLVK